MTSIAHRISGVLLFVALPFLVYLLDLSLRGPDGFAAVLAWFDNRLLRLLSVIIAWSLLHHLFTGIRHLLIDIEQGVTLPRARASAWLVNIAALGCAVIYLGWML